MDQRSPLTLQPIRDEYAAVHRQVTQIAGAMYGGWSRSDLEDLVSKVMEKYFTKFGRDGGPGRPGPLLRTIVRTTGIDMHRRVPWDQPVAPHDDERDVTDLLETMGEVERRTPSLAIVTQDLLERLFALLQPDEASLVRWRYLDGDRATDIAARLGITDEAARQKLSRATKRLRAVVAEHADFGKELRLAVSRVW